MMLLLLLNSFFYCLYCNICIWQREAEVKEQVAGQHFGSPVTLVKIPLSRVNDDFANKDEIWYHKELYDVIKRQQFHDTLYVYLLPDEEEENFVSKIDAAIRTGDEHMYNSGCTIHTERITIKIILQQYLCNPGPSYFDKIKAANSFDIIRQDTRSVIANIITPPPKPPRTPYYPVC